MRPFVHRKPVSQRVQNGAQHTIRPPPVGPDRFHDFLQPTVRGLQRLVEDVQSGCAHGSSFAI
jgi:hypothetical protein